MIFLGILVLDHRRKKIILHYYSIQDVATRKIDKYPIASSYLKSVYDFIFFEAIHLSSHYNRLFNFLYTPSIVYTLRT